MTVPGGGADAVELVAIGASWGGLDAIAQLLAGLPDPVPVPVVVVLHRAPEWSSQLPEVLTRLAGRHVCEPDDKDRLEPGGVYLAPADYHLLVEEGGGAGSNPRRVALSADPAVRYSRPSIDVLFESVAHACGPACAGVVLTGANSDGAEGLRRIHERGGLTMAQLPETAVRPEMPRAAVATGEVDVVADIDELARRLAGVLERWRSASPQGRVS